MISHLWDILLALMNSKLLRVLNASFIQSVKFFIYFDSLYYCHYFPYRWRCAYRIFYNLTLYERKENISADNKSCIHNHTHYGLMPWWWKWKAEPRNIHPQKRRKQTVEKQKNRENIQPINAPENYLYNLYIFIFFI